MGRRGRAMSINRKVDKMKMGRWETSDNLCLSEEKEKRRIEITPFKKQTMIHSD